MNALVPAPFQTIPGVLATAVATRPEHSALEDGAIRLTTAALGEQVELVGRGLLGLGVEPGDRVAIWAPNLWEWVVFALAVHAVGGALVPIIPATRAQKRHS